MHIIFFNHVINQYITHKTSVVVTEKVRLSHICWDNPFGEVVPDLST